eukprot:TRINITY_DN10900_c0_g1_i2.p4 TRINITY_DN10900_c0_g1~~TRINITY_DN10900_c0_g1_i2.p4  ORF type:complete len:102 (+),score=3.02 TRINITY_DN10900_c0_g1_i2:37-342(+)
MQRSVFCLVHSSPISLWGISPAAAGERWTTTQRHRVRPSQESANGAGASVQTASLAGAGAVAASTTVPSIAGAVAASPIVPAHAGALAASPVVLTGAATVV